MHDKMVNSIDSNLNSIIPWSCDTNWFIHHGSLKDTVTVESLDCPLDESDQGGNSAPKSPLILRPPLPDSGPCEIKICFEKKYEVGQIYVRSTARTYEIYYTNSPHSINEYLCTVRCSTAERDDKVLQINCVDGVTKERVEGPLGKVTAETASDGGHVVTGEDDWITIKVPEVQRGSASEQISTNGLNKIQDFYEATAQISDLDPCMSLTIRLLSLQDKGHVYIDEIYMFVGPVESTDSGNEAVMPESSMQSSALMAMFMPTLMQLSKSGVNHVQEKHASEEVLRDGKMETESRVTDEIECHQHVKPKELDKDTAETSQLRQHTFSKKCVEPKNVNDLPPGRVEIALQHLISRFSRVEDICLRFEEKMLKPIESIEARLQRVEDQLEKLAKSTQNFGMPHCTRISVPAFSCSESNSSSPCNDQSDYPPREASDLEKKDFSCDNSPELFDDANFHPSLVVSVPEFSCSEDDEDNADLNQLDDSACIKPNKTLSLEDALAASLNGFLSSAATNTSEHIETTLGLSTQVTEGKNDHGHAESCHVKDSDFPSADSDNRVSPRYAQVLTVKAPEFTAEETGSEEHLNNTQSSSDTASSTENVKDDYIEMVPPSTQSNNVYTSTELCDFNENKSTCTDDFASSSNGDTTAVLEESETCLYKGHINGSSKVNMIDSYFEGDAFSSPTGIDNGSAPDLAKKHDISDQDNVSKQVLVLESKNVSENLEREVAVKSCLKDDTPNFSVYSHSSLLDFQFPILEVTLTSDAQTSTKSPLEALLGGAIGSNSEARPVNDTGNADSHTEQIDGVITNSNEITNLLPINHPLVDFGVSAADYSSNLNGISHIQSTSSGPEMKVSLI